MASLFLISASTENRPDKFGFMLAVGVHIKAVLLCQLYFKLLIFLPGIRVASQVVAEGKMLPIGFSIGQADVEVVAHDTLFLIVIVPRTEECLSARQPKVTLMEIAVLGQRFDDFGKVVWTAGHSVEVDDGFGAQPFHRGGTDVFDGREVFSGIASNHLFDLFKFDLPLWVIRKDLHLAGGKGILILLQQSRSPLSADGQSFPGSRGQGRDKA